MNRLRPPRRSEGRNDRGSVFLEFALVVPLIMAMVFGLMEYGFAHRDSLTVASAARAGTRVGSNTGTHYLTDFYMIATIASGLGALPDNSTVTKVTIFKTADADGHLPPECKTATAAAAGGYSGKCNIYNEAQIENLTEVDFNLVCLATPDRKWCPATREDRQNFNPTWLGVRIEVERDMVTNLFPNQSITLVQQSVMRLEPEVT